MSHPVIGWEQETPVPNHTFNDYLSARDGRLYYEDLDLAQLFIGGREDQGLGKTLPDTVEIVYLPKIRQKIDHMRRMFAEVMDEIGYDGRFHYAYASKANAAEEVVRTVSLLVHADRSGRRTPPTSAMTFSGAAAIEPPDCRSVVRHEFKLRACRSGGQIGSEGR